MKKMFLTITFWVFLLFQSSAQAGTDDEIDNFTSISAQEYCTKIGKLDPKRQCIQTMNNTGSAYSIFTELTESFLAYCRTLSQKYVLEIGCAYGIKSSQIIQTGAFLVANDLDEKHIEIMKNAFGFFSEKNPQFSNINFIVGNVLELNLEDYGNKKFDAILIESVLHFMTPEEIRITLRKLHEFLGENGKLFITVSSPFLKYFSVPYEENKKAGHAWPGFFADPEKFIPILPGCTSPIILLIRKRYGESSA